MTPTSTLHTQPLAPNKIHSLPVVVRYHLPSSSQQFTTLFSSSQQVYVHPSTGGEGEDGWGSIYLKTVVQGVLMASPELHPCHPSTIDLSLYILDPRETYLRKSRQSTPFAGPNTSEVWTGKGLVSWALEEPGEGKNLITGRIIRSSLFESVGSQRKDLSPLEALALSNSDDEAWGIEVSLGLRSGNTPMFPLTSTPAHTAHTAPASLPMATSSSARSQVSQVIGMQPGRNMGHSRRSSVVSDISASALRAESSPIVSSMTHIPNYPTRPHAALPYRAPANLPANNSSQQPPHPLSPSRIVSTVPQTKARDVVSASSQTAHSHPAKKRRTKHTPDNHQHARARPKPSTQRKPSRPSQPSSSAQSSSSSDEEPFPDNIIAQLYKDPGSLTKDQAERLMASPAFLSRLSKLTGQPIVIDQTATADSASDVRGKKRPRVSNTRLSEQSQDKVDVKKEEEVAAPISKCWNCGRTKSAVWRMKDMGDGQTVRVCNACGLYWNKMRTMRPPKLWEGVDAEVRTTKRKDEDDRPASRVDAPTPSSNPGSSPAGFKRTMSAVVNQDAKRIAAMRKPSIFTSSGLKQSHQPEVTAPMSSPGRHTSHSTQASADKPNVRNAKWTGNALGTIAASSPGGYVEPMHPPAPPSDNFNPVPPTPKRQGQKYNAVPEDSPNTAIRKILGTNTATQSLDMPLSDDGNGISGDNATTFDWANADLSAFFDVEGFTGENSNMSMDFGQSHSLNSERTEGDDDALSQLFNRTSSGMVESSPHAFDFSQLPPSSPPVISDLPHSALLLSSPDLSPMDRKLSPLKKGSHGGTPSSGKPTPMSVGSVLSNPAPTPMAYSLSTQGQGGQSQRQGADDDKELKAFLATHQFDPTALEELWRMTGGASSGDSSSQNGGSNQKYTDPSSTAETEGMLGAGENFFAMLEKGFAGV